MKVTFNQMFSQEVSSTESPEKANHNQCMSNITINQEINNHVTRHC